MTLTRWKLMAGVLGLSLGGLAAMADTPRPAPVRTGTPCPACPACPAAPSAPVVAAPPQFAAEPPPIAVPVPTPGVVLPSGPAVAPLQLPTFEVPPPPVPSRTFAVVEVAPAPRLVAERVVELAVPMTTFEPPIVPVANPVPAPAPQTLLPVPPPQPTPVPPVSTPADLPVPSQPAANVVVEKKLRVVLNMGDDRPRFEVRDGEDALLKVVSEKVDVKSPSDRGEAMSTLKAVGRVTFMTPGGEGTCDELSVVPGTGQVVVAGKVSFKYNWGKVETEVTGERMTFRLGSAPGVIPATGVQAVPASYQRR